MTYYLIQHCADHDYAVIGTTNGQSTDFFTPWRLSTAETLTAAPSNPDGANWHSPHQLLSRHTLIAKSTDSSLTHPELFL